MHSKKRARWTEVLAVVVAGDRHERAAAGPEVVATGKSGFIKLYGVLLLFMAILGVADWFWQRHRHEKNIRMTKYEVRKEMKDIEGDPQIKARVRGLQFEMARKRMLTDVPVADVVVTNPTHFAVALKYEPGQNAPVVKLVNTLLAEAVKVTLGPKGRNVVLEKKFGSPTITKDGVTVAKEIELEGKYENMGAQLVKEVASKTSDVAGDGTTTATVLAEAIFEEGIKNVTAGANPMELKRGIEKAVEVLTEELQKLSKPVKGKAIAQVAVGGEGFSKIRDDEKPRCAIHFPPHNGSSPNPS